MANNTIPQLYTVHCAGEVLAEDCAVVGEFLNTDEGFPAAEMVSGQWVAFRDSFLDNGTRVDGQPVTLAPQTHYHWQEACKKATR